MEEIDTVIVPLLKEDHPNINTRVLPSYAILYGFATQVKYMHEYITIIDKIVTIQYDYGINVQIRFSKKQN